MTTGIVCPKCKSQNLRVVNLRRPLPGVVVRYRKCRDCGTKITTEERPRGKKITAPSTAGPKTHVPD
jgi:transcriptional regulator NrdR family protein